MTSPRTTRLRTELEKLYQDKSAELLFHGWHHIYFVAKKAIEFAEELGVDKETVEAAALTHDLNYIADPKSGPAAGKDLRVQYLTKAGFSPQEIATIEAIVVDGDVATRNSSISNEAKALSDADTLFKALPTTPVLLAGHFIVETHTDIYKLASKIINDQRPLMDNGIYFYTQGAKTKYKEWATTNLQLWENMKASLDDEDVKEMLDIAYRLKVL